MTWAPRSVPDSPLDARGVAQAVMLACHDYLRPDGIADNRRVNDRLALLRDAFEALPRRGGHRGTSNT